MLPLLSVYTNQPILLLPIHNPSVPHNTGPLPTRTSHTAYSHRTTALLRSSYDDRRRSLACYPSAAGLGRALREARHQRPNQL